MTKQFTYNVYDCSQLVGQVKASNQKEARERAEMLGIRSNSLKLVKAAK
ncbi:MAG: hypothetical protein AAGE93_21715 [Bacteroidota bacterium]